MTDQSKSEILEGSELCREVRDRLSEILDGSAPPNLYEHLSECDACRDARHEAEQAVHLAAETGSDYVAPADFEARVLKALEQRPAAAETSGVKDALDASGEQPAFALPSDTRKAARKAASAEKDRSSQPAGEGKKLESADDEESQEEEAEAEGKTAPIPIAAWIAQHKRAAWGTLAAVAAVALFWLGTRYNRGASQDATTLWRGRVAHVARAGSSAAGFQRCSPSGQPCTTLSSGGEVPAGSLLETDERTRAYIELEDGSRITLDRSTRLLLGTGEGRRARLERGALVAEVAHRAGEAARFETSHGLVEVLGTKFALRAGQDFASVEVSQGQVRLVDDQARAVLVRAGEIGRLEPGAAPEVSAAPELGQALAWSESVRAQPESELLARGFGELKAKKPGTDQELDRAVSLSSHKVNVRISGAMARTEVEEIFTNQTDQVLEGIYRFPMPPDSQVERLALDVDGKIEEGAFVERDRAQKIWRGAIVVASGQKPKPQEEIIWVPGPWRDPALLEWQRGNRFELRIYPIPKRGTRRVILAYTELLKPSAGVRRYSYPLAHDPAGSTQVDRFDVDIQVRGHDPRFGVRTAGYALEHGGDSSVQTLKLSAQRFVPSGDLTVEYALPDRSSELSAWAYRDDSAAAAKSISGTVTGGADTYVALSLRPKLPRAQDDAHRDFVLVVDSSRSMYGEGYRRATALAARIARELDPEDRVALLACDTTCRALPGGLRAPGNETAREAQQFLSTVTPEGASNVTAAVAAAVRAAPAERGRSLRIVYIGDGTPTVGPILPGLVTRAVQNVLPAERGSVSAVAVGSDWDPDTLNALARAGGGVVLPYVPGESIAETAYALLGGTYGASLRDVSVELPASLSEVAPKQPGTVVAGSETIVVARALGDRVSGDVVLRGKLAGRPFERRYPLNLNATSARGNAFVPRLFAAERIADLERETAAEARTRTIELSQRFAVASRYTSMLVLESPAMFRAFGLDNARRTPQWTGEEEAQGETGVLEAETPSVEASGMLASKEKSVAADSEFSVGGVAAPAGTSASRGASVHAAKKPSSAQPSPPRPAPEPKKAELSRAEDAPSPAPAPQASNGLGDNFGARDTRRSFTMDEGSTRFVEPRRRWIPMRRIWERAGSVFTDRLIPKTADAAQITQSEFKLRENENDRGALVRLYTLYTLSSDIDRAAQLAQHWSEKEPLDSRALTVRADMAARMGERDLAIRILGSAIDVRPDDVKAQMRLARLFRWARRPELACPHSVAMAQLRQGDAERLAEAVRCSRELGEASMAQDLFDLADSKVRDRASELLQKDRKPEDSLSGDLRVEASWDNSGVDVDIGLIHPDGHRVSWLGAPTASVISARDVTSTFGETLALRGAEPGEYVVEVVRGRGSGPVRGSLKISVAGKSQTVPFFLQGPRQTVALLSVRMVPKLVPV